MRLEEVEESLARVAKGGEVLSIKEDETWADLPGLDDKPQLLDAIATGNVVACREDVLLLDSHWFGLECRVPVLVDLGVEAVVILDMRCINTLLRCYSTAIYETCGDFSHKLKDHAVISALWCSLLRVHHCHCGRKLWKVSSLASCVMRLRLSSGQNVIGTLQERKPNTQGRNHVYFPVVTYRETRVRLEYSRLLQGRQTSLVWRACFLVSSGLIPGYSAYQPIPLP